MQLSKLFLYLLLIMMLAMSCNSNRSLTTDTYSRTLINKHERIQFLEKYFTLKTNILDAEYYISHHDNSHGRGIGPSDWYYQIAIKVDSMNIKQWVHDSLEISPFKETNWDDILPHSKFWDITGEKKYYKNGFIWIVENDILLYEDFTN